jgi:hypothetical protein
MGRTVHHDVDSVQTEAAITCHLILFCLAVLPSIQELCSACCAGSDPARPAGAPQTQGEAEQHDARTGQ